MVKFDGTTWTVYNTSNSGLPANHIRDITIDGNGNKWIGTWGGGIVKFDGTAWTVYNNPGLHPIFINTIAIDSIGNKWIGSSSNDGLTKYDDTSWTVYNVFNSGLPNSWVRKIEIDSMAISGLNSRGIKIQWNNLTVYKATI